MELDSSDSSARGGSAETQELKKERHAIRLMIEIFILAVLRNHLSGMPFVIGEDC